MHDLPFKEGSLKFLVVVDDEMVHLIDPEGVLPEEDYRLLVEGLGELFQRILDRWSGLFPLSN
jgi:hypothetical protein